MTYRPRTRRQRIAEDAIGIALVTGLIALFAGGVLIELLGWRVQ